MEESVECSAEQQATECDRVSVVIDEQVLQQVGALGADAVVIPRARAHRVRHVARAECVAVSHGCADRRYARLLYQHTSSVTTKLAQPLASLR